ncbi:RUN domain-containing protein 1 [Neocloeon triangulifer]|uniref:RUN domain-containing protein 1 n=1 Tax=Neocloeon triangulifer TaxID=2078957 RepID=UPI00286F68F4|nr:RUN domain-containing protein 1 [Neocloeon triangulifer]
MSLEEFHPPSMSEADDLEIDGKPAGERWAPLGANDPEEEAACYAHHTSISHFQFDVDKMRELEEQQEMLNSSLIALTTHFAQVQFRLSQIVEAPPTEKEMLLKDLEQFAFRGIPDYRESKTPKELLCATPPVGEDLEEKMHAQREKQRELITQLKSQLEELEKYAYETGEAGLPQSVVLERQRVIIDQLKGKLNLNVDNIDNLTVDDLKHEVDSAISQLVSPLKMKETLVAQLKTQIVDLERFIDFLQGEAPAFKGAKKDCPCKCAKNIKPTLTNSSEKNKKASFPGKFPKISTDFPSSEDEMREKTINIMKKMSDLLQMFAVTQFGCGSEAAFRKNSLKKTTKANHWGDMRARLEMAVGHILLLASGHDSFPLESDYTSDTEDAPVVMCNEELTTAVRKELAISLRDLIQHGLMPIGQSVSLVPFIGCFPQRSHSAGKMMHAWELILKYYELKNGETFNSTPARKLSQSFNLDLSGNSSTSNKESLLGAIGSIISSHTKYKRSYDSHFKALVCAALNARKLVPWLRMIFRYQPILEGYYQPWSYVVKTGFEDSFHCLEKLGELNFDLPVDLAVRQLQNIKDAF